MISAFMISHEEATITDEEEWIRFLKIYRRHKVKFVWIKGHASIPENEICDRLAVQASAGKNLPVDEAYESLSSGE